MPRRSATKRRPSGNSARPMGRAREERRAGGVHRADRRDLAIRRDDTDGVVPGVGHGHATVGAHEDSGRRVEARGCPRAVYEAWRPIACQRAHGSAGVDATDAIVAAVGDEQGTGPVERDANRSIESGSRGRAVLKARRIHRRRSSPPCRRRRHGESRGCRCRRRRWRRPRRLRCRTAYRTRRRLQARRETRALRRRWSTALPTTPGAESHSTCRHRPRRGIGAADRQRERLQRSAPKCPSRRAGRPRLSPPRRSPAASSQEAAGRGGRMDERPELPGGRSPERREKRDAEGESHEEPATHVHRSQYAARPGWLGVRSRPTRST